MALIILVLIFQMGYYIVVYRRRIALAPTPDQAYKFRIHFNFMPVLLEVFKSTTQHLPLQEQIYG